MVRVTLESKVTGDADSPPVIRDKVVRYRMDLDDDDAAEAEEEFFPGFDALDSPVRLKEVFDDPFEPPPEACTWLQQQEALWMSRQTSEATPARAG